MEFLKLEGLLYLPELFQDAGRFSVDALVLVLLKIFDLLRHPDIFDFFDNQVLVVSPAEASPSYIEDLIESLEDNVEDLNVLVLG